jgi:hypothetical protein
MHSLSQLKQTPLPLRIAFILACFALLPAAQALLLQPPPDGGYPGGQHGRERECPLRNAKGKVPRTARTGILMDL